MTGNELIVDYLTSVPAWYLATVEDTPEGAQPHVRPFSFAALQDGEIQFCTATTKDCYREMEARPRLDHPAGPREPGRPRQRGGPRGGLQAHGRPRRGLG